MSIKHRVGVELTSIQRLVFVRRGEDLEAEVVCKLTIDGVGVQSHTIAWSLTDEESNCVLSLIPSAKNAVLEALGIELEGAHDDDTEKPDDPGSTKHRAASATAREDQSTD